MSSRYEIRIAGQVNSTAAAAFESLNVTAYGRFMVVRGELDQAGLHGVLERIRSLGLDLVDVRRVRSSPGGQRGLPGRSRRGQPHLNRVIRACGKAANMAESQLWPEGAP